MLSDLFAPLFLSNLPFKDASNKDAFTPERLDLYAKSYAKPHSLNVAFEYYRVLNQGVADNKELSKSKISLPARGGQYQIDMMRCFATDVTGMVLPDGGHWLPEECPVALNQAVTEFLNC